MEITDAVVSILRERNEKIERERDYWEGRARSSEAALGNQLFVLRANVDDWIERHGELPSDAVLDLRRHLK